MNPLEMVRAIVKNELKELLFDGAWSGGNLYRFTRLLGNPNCNLVH